MKPQSKQSSVGNTKPGRIANQSKKSGLTDNETRPKHVPGPWRAHYSTYGTVLPGWQIKKDDEIGLPIALVPEPHGGKKVNGRSPWQTANARLIAAAPDLLEALKNLSRAYVNALETGRDRIVSLGGDCDGVSAMEEQSHELRSARAAIAKVEGSPE